jgi:hypothetical protein
MVATWIIAFVVTGLGDGLASGLGDGLALVDGVVPPHPEPSNATAMTLTTSPLVRSAAISAQVNRCHGRLANGAATS